MPNKRKVTASDIYNELVENFRIKEKIGSVEIKLGNITAKIQWKRCHWRPTTRMVRRMDEKQELLFQNKT